MLCVPLLPSYFHKARAAFLPDSWYSLLRTLKKTSWAHLRGGPGDPDLLRNRNFYWVAIKGHWGHHGSPGADPSLEAEVDAPMQRKTLRDRFIGSFAVVIFCSISVSRFFRTCDPDQIYHCSIKSGCILFDLLWLLVPWQNSLLR